MRVGRGRDRSSLDQFHELLKRSGGRDPKLIGNLKCSRLIRIVNRLKLSARKFSIQARMILADVPDADHANAQLFHFAAFRAAFCKNHS